MIGDIPSDFGVESESVDNLTGRYWILSDLCSEFQGAVGGFALLAVVIPGLIVAGVIFGWGNQQRELVSLAIAAVVFIVFTTVSIHSWVWLRWLRRRERLTHSLMVRAQELRFE